MIENDENNSLIRNESPRNSIIDPPLITTSILNTQIDDIKNIFDNNPPNKKDQNGKFIVSNEIANSFNFILTLFFLIFTIQMLIPQIVIVIAKRTIDFYSFFRKSYWVLIILLAIYIFISILVFFFKYQLINFYIGVTIPLFITYILIITLISTFSSFYSVELALGICIIQFCSYGIILIMNIIQCLKDKVYIKLVILYSFAFISFIIYSCVVKKDIVLCFIYLTFLMLFCAYALFEFKYMLYEFVNDLKVDPEKELSLIVYSIAMMNTNIDALVCPFK